MIRQALLALAFFGCGLAHATVLTVTGTFDDGGMVSGTITSTNNCGLVSSQQADLDTTLGSVLAGASYSGSATSVSCIGFPAGHAYAMEFTSGAFTLDLSISPVLDLPSVTTYSLVGSTETFNGQTRTLTAGSASVPTVPEPATLALIGAGLAGIGFARRRTN